MTDPAAFVLPQVRDALIGGDQEPCLIFVKTAECKAGIKVKWLAQHSIRGAGSRTHINVTYIKRYIDA